VRLIKNLFKKPLFKETLIYAVGSGFAYSFPFFFLPIISNYFGTKIFGLFEYLNSFILISSSLFALGTTEALSNYYLKFNTNAERIHLLKKITSLKLSFGLFIVFIMILFVDIINSLIFENAINRNTLILIIISVLFNQFITQYIFIKRLDFKPLSYIILNIIYNLLIYSLPVLGIILLDNSVDTYFKCYFIIVLSIFIFLIPSYYKIYKEESGHTLSLKYKRILFFSLPLLPAAFFSHFINFIDRFFIIKYLSLEDLGLYAFAYKISLIFYFFMQSFNQAFLPRSLQIIHVNDDDNISLKLSQILRYFVAACVFIILILSFFSKFIITFLGTEEFLGSYKLVGIFCISHLMFGLTYFTTLGAWKKEKSYFYTISIFISALLGVILNYFLIPKYGIIGAAFATMFTMVILNILCYLFSQSVYKIKFDLTIFALQIIVVSLGVNIYYSGFYSLMLIIFTILILASITFINKKKT